MHTTWRCLTKKSRANDVKGNNTFGESRKRALIVKAVKAENDLRIRVVGQVSLHAVSRFFSIYDIDSRLPRQVISKSNNVSTCGAILQTVLAGLI